MDTTVSKLFNSCLHNRRACENQQFGCRYIDMSSKCAKHEWFHCAYTNHCRICYRSLSGEKLSLHYNSIHGDIKHESGSTFRVKKSRDYQKFLISCEAESVVCFYKITDKEFELIIFIPVMSKWLFDYRANVKISEPEKNDYKLFNLETNYCAMCDWYIKLTAIEFLKWNYEFDICLNIKYRK